MKNHKHFLLLSPFAIAVLGTPALSLSCSKSDDSNSKPNDEFDENVDNDNNKKPEVDDNKDIGENFITKIEWILGFRNQKFLFNENNNFDLFKLDEKVLETDNFKINYIGINEKNNNCYSIFDKKIKKYYSASFECSYDYLTNNFSKSKIKNFIYTKLIESFEKEMIINHNISDKNFFIPIDTSDKTINFIKNDFLSFLSSWNVGNSQKKNVVFDLNISSTKIREMLFGAFEQNFDNFIVENVEATDLYIFPKTLVENNPVDYFEIYFDVLKDNSNDININLTDDEKSLLKLEIPGKNGLNAQAWAGTILNKTHSGKIVSGDYIGGLSSSIVTMIDSNNDNYDDLIARINKSNQESVKNYVNNIIKKGRRLAINKKVDFENNSDNLISLNFNTTIKAGASSTDWFGDRTEVGIYDIGAIQKMKVNFIEYKKF